MIVAEKYVVPDCHIFDAISQVASIRDCNDHPGALLRALQDVAFNQNVTDDSLKILFFSALLVHMDSISGRSGSNVVQDLEIAPLSYVVTVTHRPDHASGYFAHISRKEVVVPGDL